MIRRFSQWALMTCAMVLAACGGGGAPVVNNQLSAQVQSQTVTVGTSVTFTVVTTGTGPFTYQWSENGATIPGATAVSYTIAMTQLSDNGATFTVTISNGTSTATSNTATLTVGGIAPSITVQPQAQIVAAGSTASFAVTAAGSAPLTYQWSKAGTPISGATAAAYTTPATQIADSGAIFSVVVTNSAGSVTSNGAALTVVAAAPTITTQPQPQTVLAGTTATFMVAATGTGTLTYQWSRNGTVIVGATTASYTTAATALGDNGASFMVIVSDSAGSVTSSPALLTVNSLPIIAVQPQPTVVAAGAMASFAVTASGTAPLSYQWSKNGSVILGATGTSYTTAATQFTDNGAIYTVVVTNPIGSVSSAPATLTVTSVPIIGTQPQGQTVTAPGTATFSVAATGTAPLSYQWSKAASGVTTQIAGATAATYTTPATQLSDNGTTFMVVVTNSSGSTTSGAATLTVNAAPGITAQPQSQAVTVGSTATFAVTAIGTPTLTYQWSKTTGGATTAIAGATGSSYTTTAAVIGDSGTSFTVTVTNGFGFATSAAAILTVTAGAPAISVPPASQTVSAGSTATFSVVAVGNPTLTYQWSKNGTAIGGATGASYTTGAEPLSDNGAQFTVLVSNAIGSQTSSAATLTVTAVPSITTQPAGTTVTAPATASFSVVASGSTPLSYQWSKSGSAISGATAANYTTPATTYADNGATFTVKVTNSFGSATSSAATLTVNAAPAISSQPQSRTVAVGGTATFVVSATGSPTLSYQWSKTVGGTTTAIGGATSASYTTPAAALSDNGTVFFVVITNGLGNATSSNATLNVVSANVNVTTYHNDNSRTGENTQETILTPANVGSTTTFGKKWTTQVDGYVYAQPLYLANVAIGGGTHNVLYVATQHDSVYALDADTGTVLLKTGFIPSGGTTVPSSDLACTDIQPEVGITSTPVIDITTATLYFVTKFKVSGVTLQQLHAIDVTTLAEKFGGPVYIGGSTGATSDPNAISVPGNAPDAVNGRVYFSPTLENQRPSLALSQGHVIIAWSSHCDNGPWHGWVMSYGAASLAREAVFNSTPNGSSGGIWMSNAAPAVDSLGNIYLSTGNGDYDTSAGKLNYGDSILKLGPPSAGTFPVLSFFTPYNQSALNAGDRDVSSGGLILMPQSTNGNQYVMQQAKVGTIFVLDHNSLGGYCSTCTSSDASHIAQEIQNASIGIWGAPGYWNGNIYWAGGDDAGNSESMKAYAVDPTTGKLNPVPSSLSATKFSFSAPVPAISSNGTTNGILWAIDNGDTSACNVPGSQVCQGLFAYNALDLSKELWDSRQAAGYRDYPHINGQGVGGAVKFTTPTIANGKVFIGSQYGVTAYGLLP